MASQPIDLALRQQIEEIFEAAIALPLNERERFLEARCSSDHQLRAEVDALITAHERAEGVLEGNVAAAAAEALKELTSGRRIAAYRVIRELGRGGMGVVYLAERDDGQYEQRVAIKVLRASADTVELRRRFVAERQILASLKHKNVAQLLDGGVEGQLPFLVMEYVDGVPITTYCDRQKLDIEARLRLFSDVCEAVHYAHQNLIIHRDIKPGNVLVSAEGGVKLLDFGIAKLLDPELGHGDMPLTRTEFRAMTPEYASPEQIRGHVVSTASDVYALGVVLYELLTGRRPYYLTSRSPQELADIVISREPERPSVAVTRPAPSTPSGAPNDGTSEDMAQARGVSPERLRNLLSGDLDAIAMKALRKDPADRYGSADLLWQDLQRYLDGLPVLAHRGSRMYRARKFFLRHRIESAAAAVVALSLAIGAAVAVRQATVAGRERDRAERALTEAEQSLRQSESVTGFLVGLFDASAPAPGGGVVTAQELLRRGSMQVERLYNQPLTQARMLEAIGRVHQTMNQYPQAQAALERSLAVREARLGPNHPEVATTLYYLGDVHRRLSHYRAADSVTRRAIAIRTALFGPRHPAVAEALVQLSFMAVFLSDLPGAEELARQALNIRRETLEADDPLIGESLAQHAAMMRRLGRQSEAEVELREAIAVYQAAGGPQNPEVASMQLRLADLVLTVRGDTVHAESLRQSALFITRASLGENHLRTAQAMGDVASILSLRGEHARAVQYAEQSLAIAQRAVGPQRVQSSKEMLSEIYMRAGKLIEAEREAREAAEMWERNSGATTTAYAGSLGFWSERLLALGRHDDAIAVRRRMLAIRGKIFNDSGPLYGVDLGRLARVYARKGDYKMADSLFSVALANQARHVPETHPDVREIYSNMAERYRQEGKRAEAERYAKLAAPR